MKQNVSPKVFLSVIALVVLVVAVFAYQTYNAPSSKVMVSAMDSKAARNPTGGGGPTEADFQRMREYNAAHPGAASSKR